MGVLGDLPWSRSGKLPGKGKGQPVAAGGILPGKVNVKYQAGRVHPGSKPVKLSVKQLTGQNLPGQGTGNRPEKITKIQPADRDLPGRSTAKSPVLVTLIQRADKYLPENKPVNPETQPEKGNHGKDPGMMKQMIPIS